MTHLLLKTTPICASLSLQDWHLPDPVSRAFHQHPNRKNGSIWLFPFAIYSKSPILYGDGSVYYPPDEIPLTFPTSAEKRTLCSER